MSDNKQNNQNNIGFAQKNPQKPATGSTTPEQLEKALGIGGVPPTETVKVATTPAEPEKTPEAGVPSTLDTILNTLPEKVRDSIMKLPEANRLEIAQDYFKLSHPEGLAEEFKKRLAEELPTLIKKLAGEYLVDVTGKRVQVMFPDGEGNVVADVVDPNAKATAAKGKEGMKTPWGESSATEKSGKVIHFDSPGAMGKHYGLLMKGWMFKDTTECFTKPHDTNGNPLKERWSITSAVKGQGIHIQEI